MNAARKALLSQIAETRFGLGEVDVDLVVPAYVQCSGMRNVQQTQQTLADAPGANQVLDYNRFEREVDAGAGTVSDIVWFSPLQASARGQDETCSRFAACFYLGPRSKFLQTPCCRGCCSCPLIAKLTSTTAMAQEGALESSWTL